MSDPSRLRDDVGGDAFAQALLRSASFDREPEDGAARALAALGAAATVSAVGLAGSSTSPLAAAASTSAVGASIVVKTAGIALLTAGIVAGGVIASGAPATRSPSSAPSTVRTAAVTVAAQAGSVSDHVPASHSAPAETEVTEEMTAIAVGDLPSAPIALPAPSASSRLAAAPAARAATSPASAPMPTRTSVSEELLLIDEARTALARGDVADAEHTLDAYDARFANGTLSLEAKLARIELLLARSDKDGAYDLCEQFLREHPRTAYERRVRALLRRARPESSISR
jgi:Outer membrane lipoprotein